MREPLKKVLTIMMILSASLSMMGQDLPLSMHEHLMAARPLYGKDTISLFFIGDVMMHARQMEYPTGPFLEGISNRMKSADITVANMEFTLAGKPYSGYPTFSAPDSYAYYIHNCGANVFLTANNHILDKGTSGLKRTIGIYHDMEQEGLIKYTGVSSDSSDNAMRYPLMLNVKGIRIALVNFTYGTNVKTDKEWPKVNRMSKKDIASALKRAKERGADFIIALPHWGNEYELRHSTEQENMAKWLAANGVNVIIGTHPHVVQDSTLINNVPVFYSIGNVVSNLSAENTRIELAVEIKFLRDWNGDLTMLKPSVTYLWCSLPERLRENYATIAVQDYIGKRSIWRTPSDYDIMISTYLHVKEATGVNDCMDSIYAGHDNR